MPTPQQSPTAGAGEVLDLYHRTSSEAAAQIFTQTAMTSKENTAEAFFSTHPDVHITGYGPTVVHIRIPRTWIEDDIARLDDEFPLGDDVYESHYAIAVRHLRPEHFIAVYDDPRV